MNNCAFVGRLTSDVELKQTNGGKSVCSFSLAVNGATKDAETEFIDCTAFGQRAEFIARNGYKGRLFWVTGKLHIRKWTSRSGDTHRNSEIWIDDCSPLDKREQPEQEKAAPQKYTPAAYEEVPADDDLPF